METITLNDGTVVDGHCIETDEALFVYLDGMNMIEGIMLFNDPGRTIMMTELNHGVEHVYSGYTKISAASSEYGNCNLVMRRNNNA